MTQGMVTRQLTPEMAAAASTLVKIAHPGDTSLSRACDRAQERLFHQPWTVVAGILQIASHSQPGDVQHTDGMTCTCPTSKGVCYHVAGWLMLSTLAAAGVAPVAPLPLPIELDEDELPAESFLDGDFSAFADDSLTHDQYGRLLPEFAPTIQPDDEDPDKVWFEEVDSLHPEDQLAAARAAKLAAFEEATRLVDELFAA